MRRITVLLSVMVLVLGMTGMAAIAEEALFDGDDALDDDSTTAASFSGEVVVEPEPEDSYLQGETIEDVTINAEDVDGVEGDDVRQLAVVVDGDGPDVGPGGEQVCQELFDNCDDLLDSVGTDNLIEEDGDTTLFDDTVTINEDAATGDYVLGFYLVEDDEDGLVIHETSIGFEVEPRDLDVSVEFSSADTSLLPGTAGEYEVTTTNAEGSNVDLDAGWFLGLEIEGLDSEEDVTIEFCSDNTYENCETVEETGAETKFVDGVLQIRGGVEAEGIAAGSEDVQHFTATFEDSGQFTGTVFVFEADS